MASRIVSYKETVDKILKGDINFIGFIVTPWHYVGIQAAIEMLKERGEKILPLIVFGNHVDTGYAIDISAMPDNCYLLEDGKIPLTGSNLFKKIIYYFKAQHSKTKDVVYLFSAWHYSVMRMEYFYSILPRRYILGIVDEGVATYMNHRSFKRIVEDYLVSNTLNNNIYFNLFFIKGKKLLPNIEAVKWYKKILTIDGRSNIKQTRRILIATPCFEDRPEEDIELGIKFSAIIKELQRSGYNCMIKPHPRERNVLSKYSMLGCDIVDKTMSLEEYIAQIRPMSVISTSSTSLVTAKMFYDVKPVSIVKLLDQAQFSERHRDEMSSFEKVFVDIVSFPDTISGVVLESTRQ